MTYFDPNIHPPKNISIEITSECNLRCKHCHLWMSKEHEESLTTDEKLDLIRQFHEMSPGGSVSLYGGEPMSKLEEFFSMTKLGNELNLMTASNTNLSYVDESLFERVCVEGPLTLMVSLDSHIEKIHEYVRGVKGAFKHVTETTKKLVAYRKEHHPGSFQKVFTNTVIFDENINYWEDYIEFARNELGVDGVTFQMLSGTFYNQNKKGDHFYAKHFIKDVKNAQTVIDRILNKYGDDPFMSVSKNDLEWMKSYVEDPNFVGEQVCGSHEKNVIINQYGEVQLCFNMLDEISNGDPLGSVRKKTLKELWSSQFAEELRDIMSTCCLSCGMLSCHRKPVPDISPTWQLPSRRVIDQLVG